MEAVIQSIPTSQIEAGDNDRKAFDLVALAQLADSIRRDGLIQPITVREVGLTLEGPRYQIVAGERRFRACTELLEWDTVPCVVRDYTDATAARVMLAENTIRADLDPIEEGRAYQRRIQAGATVDQLVAEGQSRARIDLLVPLLTLVPEAQHLIARRQLAPTVATRLVGLCANRQGMAIREFANGDMTSAQFKALCDRLRAEQQADPLFDPDSFLTLATWAKATPKMGKLGQARQMLKRCAEAVEATDPQLAAEVRSLLQQMNGQRPPRL